MKKQTMKKLILAAFAAVTFAAAMPTGAMAETTNTVTVTKFHQSYPYLGKATVEYTVGGTIPANAVAEFTLNMDGASVTFTQNNVVEGANTNVIDFASSFGGALVLTNASFVVTINLNPGSNNLGGIQLWENGAYWAECNVGASEPKQYGYYFWWGDTVGYTNTGYGTTWISVKDGSGISFTDSGTAAATYGKDSSTLLAEGWIDSTGNLAPEHDAATAHRGAPWRMPTEAEFEALMNNCDSEWITMNGTPGRLMTGRGAYANRSVFLPAGARGYGSSRYAPRSEGYYWSSTPSSFSSSRFLLFSKNGAFYRSDNSSRYSGYSVRPVRGFSGCNATGVITYDPDVFVIESVDDWNAFSAIVADGLPPEGMNVLLASDVSNVTVSVGDSGHPFRGTFNGNGHTLTVAIESTDVWAAPFYYINGATISNLTVTGSVTGGGNHAAGLVGACGASNPNVIRDCTVAVDVVAAGTGYAGGIVGQGGDSTLSFEDCVFSGSVSGFTAFAGGLLGWGNTMTLTINNCLVTGTFTPTGNGKFHPIACKFANRTVTATVTDAYYLNTVISTATGDNLVPGAGGTPVSATFVHGGWDQAVIAADGNTYYRWTAAPAGRLLVRYSFDDAGNSGANLLRAAVGSAAIVRATQTTPVAGIGNLAAVTNASVLSGLSTGDGAVAIPNGQHLAVPIPAPLLAGSGRPYTVVMKIRVPDNVGWRSLLNMPASNDTDAMVFLHQTTRNIYLKQFDKSSGAGVAASNGNVAADQWTTLTFAFGENTTDIYRNGTHVLHTTGALAGSYADCAASGGYILVGAGDSYDDDLFYLAEFRIYEGAVAAVESLPGSGTASDPYLISSLDDWSLFASNVCIGVDAAACYRLEADIGSVTNTVGTSAHPFAGVFDGGSNTLTLALSGTDSFLAPFSTIGGATISNLVVDGTVAGNMHCSGLVGRIVDGTNVIENCEVAAAITSSGSHFGGVIGHSITYAATLRGCVFSGSLSGGTYVATFHGWSDGGAETTLIDCLDASGSNQPIGRGHDAVCVSNTYYLASKYFGNGERLWSEGKRGKRAYAVTGGEGVTIDFGTPSATYGTAGIAAYSAGMVYRESGTPVASSGTFYAAEGEVMPLDLAATPPSGMILNAYAASAGTLSQSGNAWTLTMPAAAVVVSANWTTGVIDLSTLTADYTAVDGEVLTGETAYNVTIPAGATVTLSNAVIEASSGPSITCLGDAVIVLEGSNTVIGHYDANYDHGYPGIQAGPANTTLEIFGGGSLTVVSDEFAAGIGSDDGGCGNIVISGGTIVATGGIFAAGIGSGWGGGCGDIVISGGTIAATGGSSASGIGGGSDGECGDIVISGGTIAATGGDYAVGIGSGIEAECGNIVISGGTVTATGGRDAGGIGSSHYSKCGNITITDGVTLLTSVNSGLGSNIGAGFFGSCGTVTVGGREMDEIAVSPYVYRPSDVPFAVSFDANGGNGSMVGQSFSSGIPQNLSSNGFTRAGCLFNGWNTRADGSGVYYYDGQPATFGSDTTLYAQWCGADVTLTPETGFVALVDGQVLSGTGGTNTHVVVVPGATVTLSNVTINGSKESEWAGITCLGDAVIVLEGLNTVNGGCDANDEYGRSGIQPGPADTTLAIRGPGSLTAKGAVDSSGIGGGWVTPCGDIVIQGGTITAIGDDGAAGIGSGIAGECGDIVIQGGTITAFGNGYAAGIGSGTEGECGDIVIQGGTVTAIGDGEAAGIGSGVMGSCGNITITDGVRFVSVTCGEWALNPIGAGVDGTCGTVTVAEGLLDVTEGDTRTITNPSAPNFDTHGKVQLWAGGPFWAETNVGADDPWDYGLYFWWGDTIGYWRENDAWVASGGSPSNFSFEEGNTPTNGKDYDTLQSEGWITAEGVLAPAHDPAHAHWGGGWRTPTEWELADLCDNCDWTWATTNGICGYIVRGRGNFANASIFLPVAGVGSERDIYVAGEEGYYLSSVPYDDTAFESAWCLACNSTWVTGLPGSIPRFVGIPVRPVQTPTQIDLSTLTADYTARDGNVLMGVTVHTVTVPGGANVTVNGVSVTGANGAAVPEPEFAVGCEAAITEFTQGVGGRWAITTFAELSNNAVGADVPDGAIKVCRGDTVGGITNVVAPTITGKKSAVKVEMTVEAPSSTPQFFRVGFDSGTPGAKQSAQIDLSTLTADYTAQDGDVMTGETTYNVTVPGGATVTINGIRITGGGTTVPAFAVGREAATMTVAKGTGNTWTITAFAEFANNAVGADVPDGAIKVYRGDTADGITNAVTPTITGKKSAVKVEMTVGAPAEAPQQFFKVKFGGYGGVVQ